MDAKKNGQLVRLKTVEHTLEYPNIHTATKVYMMTQFGVVPLESQEECPWWGLGSALRAAVVGLFQGVF